MQRGGSLAEARTLRRHTMSTFQTHLAAVQAGSVERGNIIGIRKAFNAFERRCLRLSTSSTAPKWTADQVTEMDRALADVEPVVTGPWHDSGAKQLRSPRYAKRLERVRDVIADPDMRFQLIAYDRLGTHGLYSVPVYRVCGGGRSFFMRNIPWQSGGDGPEIVSDPRP
jgi:hypothetical protein